jgi:hypothetical protein
MQSNLTSEPCELETINRYPAMIDSFAEVNLQNK